MTMPPASPFHETSREVKGKVVALQKAIIANLDSKDPNDSVECMFNPTQYTFSKTNQWSDTKKLQQGIPAVEFTGGDAMTLDMDLFFDTYEEQRDVRVYTDKIWNLMKVDKNLKDYCPQPTRSKKSGKGGPQGRPPLCEFRWGESMGKKTKTWSFQAAIESLSQTYTLFLGDGTPVRATLKVKFKQVKASDDYKHQNPTTASVAGYKARVVRQGETIDWIAYDEYGDSSGWRQLADANDLEDPLSLEAGMVLAIPPTP